MEKNRSEIILVLHFVHRGLPILITVQQGFYILKTPSYSHFKAGVLNMSFQHLINEYRSLETVSVEKASIKQHCVSDTITFGFLGLGWSRWRDTGTQNLSAFIFLGGEICHEEGAGGALIQISSVTVTHYELTSPTYRSLAPSFSRVSVNRTPLRISPSAVFSRAD